MASLRRLPGKRRKKLKRAVLVLLRDGYFVDERQARTVANQILKFCDQHFSHTKRAIDLYKQNAEAHNGDIHRAVKEGLSETIAHHGYITADLIPSAEKRIHGKLHHHSQLYAARQARARRPVRHDAPAGSVPAQAGHGRRVPIDQPPA